MALDLINLSLSGGQNVYAALASVSREVEHAFPVLAEELQIVREQAELSNLSLALHRFAERTNITDVRNLAMVLAQTDRLGTDVSAGLMEYAQNLRLTLRHRAEAQANRANFWMIFPTILCLWIPAAMMLFGPVYFQFVKQRTDNQEMLRTGRQDLDRAQKRPMPSAAQSTDASVRP
jgi:Flp pilus assembly protein TadB